jgi:K+-transporting ATPase ATPase B chain
VTGRARPAGFILAVTLWRATLLFANFAEAIAEGRSKAHAGALKHARKDTIAKKLAQPRRDAIRTPTPSASLRKGDIVLVEQGDLVPGDGEVIEGVASINESAITGESAPVIRPRARLQHGDRRTLGDWIVVRISVNPGEAFLDRMIEMVDGAKRQRAQRIALTILLVVVTLVPAGDGHAAAVLALQRRGGEAGTPVSICLVALLVPDPDDDRAGSNRRQRGQRKMMRQRDHLGAGGRGRRHATCCCSTRPARHPATGRHRRCTRWRRLPPTNWPRRR